MKWFVVFLFGFGFFLSSCHEQNKEVLTQRIQYDVLIESPDPAYDWWIQNLEGPAREKLVKRIIEGALAGDYVAYDYYNQPMEAADIAHILTDTLIKTLYEPEPPYEAYDTAIVNKILPTDIKKIRFLEKWHWNPHTLEFQKEILGIAPIARRLDAQGIERWQPLFWIYTDDEYPANIKP